MAQSVSGKNPGLKELPPIPASFNPLHDTLAFQRAPLEFLTERQKQFGDVFQFRLVNQPMVFINHPDDVGRVFQENHLNYDKNLFLFRIYKSFLGEGLVTVSDNKKWLKRRRLMQPAFHRQQVAGFATIMSDFTEQMLSRWDTTYARSGDPFEVWQEMGNVILDIVCAALFSMDSQAVKKYDIISTFRQTMDFLGEYAKAPIIPLKFPTPRHRRFWRLLKSLDSIINEILSQRRENHEEKSDLLGMLLAAVDEEGSGMDNEQLRDELMTLLVAGYETTASTLAWTWYLLSQHPEVEQRLHEEIDNILAGRTPTVDDVSRLPYTRMVIDESMRLYPASWQTFRRAINEDALGGYRIPANSGIYISSFFLHRRPDLWEKPNEFYPEHFLPENVEKRHRRAFIPFNYGPRMCIGSSFAMLEIQIILVMIAQKYRLKFLPGQDVEPQPRATLQPPDGDIKAVLERRF